MKLFKKKGSTTKPVGDDAGSVVKVDRITGAMRVDTRELFRRQSTLDLLDRAKDVEQTISGNRLS